MRSMLFVPGDDMRKLMKARDSAADALIADLEDAVSSSLKSSARQVVREFLATERRQPVFVRINGLDDPEFAEDLSAVVGARPDGIMLPRCRSAADVHTLEYVLTALEVREGVSRGGVRILPIAMELATAAFHLDGYKNVSPRLCGLMWGVEDLAVDLNSEVSSDDGRYLPAVELGRSLCLYAAAAAGVPAIDAVYSDFKNLDGLEAAAIASRRAGFSCKAAIHPQQVDIINRTFTPGAEAVARAQRIVEAFRAEPGKGAIAIDGRMHDRPHLRAAQLVLARIAGEVK